MDPQPPSFPLEPAPAPRAGWLARIARFKRPLVAIAGVGAVLSGLAGWWNAYSTIHNATSTSSAANVAVTAPAVKVPLSTVVMPFANLTGDPQKLYIADGLTAAFTETFGNVADSYVVPAATARTYRDKNLTVQQVGQALGVAYALSGTVQSSGTTLRVSIQFIDTATGTQLWGHSFDGDVADVIALEDRVTRETREKVYTTMLTHAAQAAQQRQATLSAEDLKLRARALGLQPESIESLKQQETLFRQAAQFNPNDAWAKVGLAWTLQLLASDWERGQSNVERRKAHLAEAHRIVAQLSAVNPDDPMVCILTGTLAISDRDHAFAKRTLERCAELKPNMSYLLRNLAIVYVFDGPEGSRKGVSLMEKAIANSGSHVNNTYLVGLGEARFLAGDSAHAIEPLETALHMNAEFSDALCYLAMAYADVGETSRLAELRAKIVAINPPGFAFKDFEQDNSVDTAGYRTLREQRILPLWRKAGLPL